jgi:hypothetical protein
MSTTDEIAKAVQELSADELARFREWFVGYDQALWDKQMEGDIAAGRFDSLADEALEDLKKNRCADL